MNVTFELSAKIFKEIIEGAIKTLDKDNMQAHTKVVLLEIFEKKVRFISNNNEIILEQEINVTTKNFSEDFSLGLDFFIKNLEENTFSLLQIPITKESKGNILFSVKETACQIIYQAKKYDISTTTTAYPNYENIVSVKNPYFFTISTENLQKAMNRAVLLYPSLKYKNDVMTRFFIEDKKMFVTTINQDKDAQMEEIFDVEVKNPPKNKFGFAMYSPYMQLASTLLEDCEEIKITYLSPQKVFLTSCDQAEVKRKLALFPKQGTNYPEQDGENGTKYKNVLFNVGETKNITISSKTLYDALAIVKDFVAETKNNDNFSLIDRFYFKVTEGQIEIIVKIFDDNLVKVTFPVGNSKNTQEFCSLINFSDFYRFLNPKNLFVQPITLKFGEENYKNVLEVVHENGTALFAGLLCKIYPKFNYPTEKTSLGTIDAAKFSKKWEKSLLRKSDYKKDIKTEYVKIISKTQLKEYKISRIGGSLLPKNGFFELFFSKSNGNKSYFDKICSITTTSNKMTTEMFFGVDSFQHTEETMDELLEKIEDYKKSAAFTEEEYQKQIFFLEDVGTIHPNEQDYIKNILKRELEVRRSAFEKVGKNKEESLSIEELKYAIRYKGDFREITLDRLQELLKERETTPKIITKTTQKDKNTATYEVKGTDYTQADQDEYLQQIFNTIKFNDEESLSTKDLKLAIEELFLDKITKKRLEQLLKNREKEAKTTPDSYFLDVNLPNFQGNITEYSLRNPQTEVYDRVALFGADQKKRKEMEINQKWIWSDTLKYLEEAGIDTGQNGRTSVQSPSDFEKTIGYWNAEAEPSIFFNIKSANSGDKWEKICALTHFAEEFRQDAFIVKHRIPKEVAETLLDDEENYLKEFENGFILMPEVTFVFENMAKEDVFTIEKEILQVFGDFTIFTEVKEKDRTTLFSVSFFHQTNTTNENDKRKEISQAYGEFDEKIKGLEGKFGQKSTQNIQGIYRNSDTSLDLSRLFCADNMGDTSNDLRTYNDVRNQINTMLTKYGRKPCTYASDSKNTGLSAVAVVNKETAPKEYNKVLNFVKELFGKYIIDQNQKADSYWGYADGFIENFAKDVQQNNITLEASAINGHFTNLNYTHIIGQERNEPQNNVKIFYWYGRFDYDLRFMFGGYEDPYRRYSFRKNFEGQFLAELGKNKVANDKESISDFFDVLMKKGVIFIKNGGKLYGMKGREEERPEIKAMATSIETQTKGEKQAPEDNQMWLSLQKQLIKEAHKGYDHFNLWYAETFLLKKGNRDAHKDILANLSLKENAKIDEIWNALKNSSKQTNSTKEVPKLSIVERIDALKTALKYAKKEAKQSLLDRIKALKISLKYVKK